MKGIGRMFAGESLFMATYEAERPDTTIAFASTAPGQILPVDVGANGGLICQKGAFLCAQETVNLQVTFTRKFSSGLFGGEGFILQDISGSGECRNSIGECAISSIDDAFTITGKPDSETWDRMDCPHIAYREWPYPFLNALIYDRGV